MHPVARWSVLLLAVTACEAEPDFSLPPVVARTDRVEYRSESPLDQCPGAPARVQTRLEGLESVLGVRGPERIRYSKFDVEAHVKANCDGAVGCSFGADALSMLYLDGHEMVHVVMPSRRPPRLFREGVAVALGYGALKPSAPWPAWRDIVSGAGLATYTYGGAFVTYLAETYGIDSFVRFFTSSWGEGEGAADLAREFGLRFPVSLDEAWQAAAGVAGASSLCAGLEPTLTTDGSEAVPAGEDCVGGWVEGRHAFVLDADTPLGIESTYGFTWIGACGLNVDAPFWTEPFGKHADSSVALFLAAWQKGKYYVNAEVSRPDESFRAQRGAWMGAACDQIEPYRVTDNVSQIQMMVRGKLDTWVALEWVGSAPLVFPDVRTLAAPYQWSICGGCDEARCTRVDLSAEALTLQPGVSWLHAVQQSDNPSPSDGFVALR